MRNIILLLPLSFSCSAIQLPIDEQAKKTKISSIFTQKAFLQQAATCCSQYKEILQRLIKLHIDTNQYDLAEYYLKRIISLDHENMCAHKEFAHLLQKQERCTEALEHYHAILRKDPRNINIHFEAAFACIMMGLVDEAIGHYDIILSQHPQATQVLHNKGYCLKMADRLDEALIYYHQKLALDPNNFQTRYAIALSYLTKGDFETGWKWYETYLKHEHINGDNLRIFLAKNTLTGKRVFLRHQGGFGDTLQFIRFAKLLHEQGAHILALVPKPILPLLKQCSYIDNVFSTSSTIPEHDTTTTIMSLGAILSATENLICNLVPYLEADPLLITLWKDRLAHDKHFKIGLCWQSDVKNDQSRLPIARRGIPLAFLSTLAEIPGISFYSLQYGDGVDQLKNSSHSFTLHIFDQDFDQRHGRFMDTAAIMKNLDLVITVDTALAHLAGGLGVPTWLMLPYSSDWRWIAGRDTSPWYPQMKIFKQHKPFDWIQVVADIKLELQKIIQS